MSSPLIYFKLSSMGELNLLSNLFHSFLSTLCSRSVTEIDKR